MDRDGRLAVGDEIREINEYPLGAVSFTKAQEIFKVTSGQESTCVSQHGQITDAGIYLVFLGF